MSARLMQPNAAASGKVGVKKATPHGILKAEIVVPIEIQRASPDLNRRHAVMACDA